MENGFEIGVGHEFNNSLSGNIRKIEMKTGLEFKGSVGFEYSEGKPFFEDNLDLKNPWIGFFDYDNRKIFINPEQFEKQKGGFYREIDQEYVKDHELLHILERDILGRGPEYPHLIHAVLDEAERKRILSMAFFIKDANYQKVVFGREIHLNLNIDNDLELLDSIVRTESCLLSSMDVKKNQNISIEQVGIASLMASDLNLLKTVLFSKRIISPKVALDFDSQAVNLEPALTLLGGTKIYRTNDELTLINSLGSQ